MIGLLVRETANPADGRRQQTHATICTTVNIALLTFERWIFNSGTAEFGARTSFQRAGYVLVYTRSILVSFLHWHLLSAYTCRHSLDSSYSSSLVEYAITRVTRNMELQVQLMMSQTIGISLYVTVCLNMYFSCFPCHVDCVCVCRTISGYRSMFERSGSVSGFRCPRACGGTTSALIQHVYILCV